MSVCIDGSVLSSLLFNHLNSQGSQYGFLMGEKIEHIEDRISDSQIHTSDVNAFIYISAFAPWPDHESMYSRSGHINDQWIQHLLRDSKQDLVGWYSFRHNSSPRPSLREVSLHSNLVNSEQFDGLPEDFLFFLCTSSFSTSMSTHTCNHGFMHIVDGHFLKVPMNVMNLGDTTRKEYRTRSNATLSHNETIQGSLKKFQKEFLKSSGSMEQISKVKNLSASMNKALKSVHSKVAESEAVLGLLETDVSYLRERLSQLEEEEMNQIFEIEEKKRLEEDEARRKQDAKEDAEEEQQLEKLLVDLGISYNDSNGVASNAAAAVPSTVLKEQFETDLSQVDIKLIEPGPPPSMKSYVQIDSKHVQTSDASTLACSSASSGLNAKTPSAQQRCPVNNTEDTNSSKTQDLKKQKQSDPFAFLEDEFKLKEAADKQDQASVANKPKAGAVGKAKVQDENRKVWLSKSSNQVLNKPEMSKLGISQAPVSGVPFDSASDAVNGSQEHEDISFIDAETKGKSFSKSTVDDENFTLSSSPTF